MEELTQKIINELTIESYHAVFFIQNIVPPNVKSGQFFSKLATEFAQDFDGQPLQIPLPEDERPDLPRLIMNDENGSRELNLSFKQINVIWNNKGGNKDWTVNSEGIVQLSRKVLSDLQTIRDNPEPLLINRIGFIMRASLPHQPELFQDLIQTIINPSRIQDLKGVNLQLSYQFQQDSRIFNRVLTLAQGNKNHEDVLWISIDINTPADQDLASNIDSGLSAILTAYHTANSKEQLAKLVSDNHE